MPGFGERSEQRLLASIAALSTQRTEVLLPDAAQAGESLLAHLLRHPGVEQAELAGDLRRRIELIARIDLVVSTRDPEAVFDHVARAPMTGSVRERTAQEASVRLLTGLDVSLHAVPPDAYGIGLLRATGSAAHVAKLQAVGQTRGVRLTDDGLHRGSRPLRVRAEDDVYRHLGLPAIPPELREDVGEVEAALAGTLPVDLVRRDDVRGLVHRHTVYRTGRTRSRRWPAAPRL